MNTTIVKTHSSHGSVPISQVYNDCISLCVPTVKGESLASILQKMCARMEECCGEDGDGQQFLEAGDGITVEGDGSQGNPWIVSADDTGDNFMTLDSESVDLQGNGSINTPLYALVRRDPAANNMLVITPAGVLVPNVIESGIVYGGIVTWLGDYNYHITAAGYWLDFQFYESPAADFTLSPPDATFNRIDTFILTSSETAEVLEGTPSSNPAQAPLDTATQLAVSFSLVEVGTTEPTINSECIYRNNTEWTATSSSLARLNPDSVTNPCNGVKALEGTGVVDNDNILFERGSSFFPTTITSQLTFFIRPKGSFAANGLIFQWELAGTPVGDPVVLNHLSYFFDSTDTGTCQLIAIPLFHFGLVDTSEVDSLRITGEIAAGTVGFYIDDLCIQGQPLPPQAESVDNKFKIDDDDVAPGTFNEKIEAGSGIVFTETTDSEGYKTLEISAVATSPLTFDNGLTRTLDNTQWGGPLLHDTTINADEFKINFWGTNDVSEVFNVINNGSKQAILTQAGDGEAIQAETDGIGNAVFAFASGGGKGVVGVSLLSDGGEFQSNAPGTTALRTSGPLSATLRSFDSTDNDSVVHSIFLRSLSSGTAQIGFGGYVSYELEADDGLTYESNRTQWEWLNPAADPSNDLTSRYSIWGYNLGALTQLAYWNGDGQQVNPEYGVGAFTGTPTAHLAVTATGEVIEVPAGGSGLLISADNGLNENPTNNVRLGGTLLENTTITSPDAFTFLITGDETTFTAGVLNVVNTANSLGWAIHATGGNGTGGAIRAISNASFATIFGYNPSGTGVRGDTDANANAVQGYASTNGTGVNGASETGIGGIFQSTSNTGLYSNTLSEVNSTTTYSARIQKGFGGAPGTVMNTLVVAAAAGNGAGSGVAIDMEVPFNSGSVPTTRFISRATTGLLGSSEADFIIQARTANALYDAFSILGVSGQAFLHEYGTGALALGGEAFALAVTAAGGIVEIPIGAGAGDVVKVGTPVNNQLGVWTGDGTIEGDPALTFTGGVLTIGEAGTTLGQLVLAGNTAQTVTIKTLATAGNYTLTLPPNDGGAGEFLTTDGAGVLTWTAAPGGGTVTDVSVVTANGFAGSVANPTTSPDITISTTETGLLQGNGTAISGITNSSTVGQVLRVTGASTYAWGALDLADTDAVTGDLAFANLTQGTARSVLAVAGNSTADFASVQGTANQVLVINAAGTALLFGQVNLASSAAVTGTLPFINGGTGLSALGTPNQVLRVNGAGTALEYATLAGSGTVTNVSTTLSGISIADPSTTPAISGTLGPISGGTGITSYAQGDLIVATAANTLGKIGKSALATRYLANTGVANQPQWDQINLANGVTGRLPFANVAQITGPAVLGVTGTGLSNLAAMLATADGQIMRRSGANIGFGAINVGSAAAITGILPVANGGSGLATAPSGQIRIGNGTVLVNATPTGSLGITAQPTAGALNYRLTVNPTRQTFVDTTGTATWNLDNGQAGNVVLTNVGRTLVISGTPVAGTTYTLEVRQDGTGNRTITTWPATILWEGGSVPTLSTGINKIDLFTFYYTGANYLGKLVGRFN